MVSFNLEKAFLLTVILAGILVGSLPESVVGQVCPCVDPNMCCSHFGYCGDSDEHCGFGCTQGNCKRSDVVVASVVTNEFFDGIIPKAGADADCPGKKFYTRAAFIEALEYFPKFGTCCSEDSSKREIAAFFAHVTQETGSFCHINEINGDTHNYCDEEGTHKEYKCVENKEYYGRGPMQLSWNYNYGAAGKALNLDLLNNPDKVAEDVLVSFKTALWYWMENVNYRMKNGFGDTIRAINGEKECNGNNPDAVKARKNRIAYYTEYCNLFKVNPGNDLDCGSTAQWQSII